MDAIINTMEYINIPVFSIPGLSCVYPDVSVYSVTAVYFLAPIIIGLYIRLVYSLVGWWLKMKKNSLKAHGTGDIDEVKELTVSEPQPKTPKNSGFAGVLIICLSREESERSSLSI